MGWSCWGCYGSVFFSETGVELFAASVVGKIFLYLIFCVFGGGEFPVAFN
jgi:hypothetical protein